MSQSLALLRDDVRWWFSASDHGVKIVLLIKFGQGQDQLVLEKWEEEESPAPPGSGQEVERASAASAWSGGKRS